MGQFQAARATSPLNSRYAGRAAWQVSYIRYRAMGRPGPGECPEETSYPALFQFKRSVKVTITIPQRANHLFMRCPDAPLIYSRQLIIAE